MRALKGSAFVASSMTASQHSPMDHLMYYDARICNWCGLFDQLSLEPLKPYYAIWNFNKLYGLGKEVASEGDEELKVLAAKNGEDTEGAILLTYYKDHPSYDGDGTEAEARRVRIDWSGFAGGDGVEVEYRFLDAQNDNRVVSAETFFGETGAHVFDLPLYTSILVSLKKK